MRRIIEGLFINFLWWLVQGAIVAVPFIVAASKPDTHLSGPKYLFISLAAGILLYIAWYLGRRYYPPFRWDIIHDKNTYTLIYETRESASYKRHVMAIPLRKNIEAFKDGEYRWSGSSSTPFIVEADDFKASFEKKHGRTEYTIRPEIIVKAYKPLPYTLGVDLRDDNHTALPINFIYIKRPTKRITLVVKMAASIPIRNVRYVARTKYGEENKLIFKKGHPAQENGYNIYKFSVRRPKLFTEYEICWEWCE